MSPVDVVCLPTLPTQDWDSIAGDPKQEAGGATRERVEDLQQLEAEGDKREIPSEGDRFEECVRDDTGLRPAPSLLVGGDVGTEAPQCGPQIGPQSEGVAAPGVALQNSLEQ